MRMSITPSWPSKILIRCLLSQIDLLVSISGSLNKSWKMNVTPRNKTKWWTGSVILKILETSKKVSKLTLWEAEWVVDLEDNTLVTWTNSTHNNDMEEVISNAANTNKEEVAKEITEVDREEEEMLAVVLSNHALTRDRVACLIQVQCNHLSHKLKEDSQPRDHHQLQMLYSHSIKLLSHSLLFNKSASLKSTFRNCKVCRTEMRGWSLLETQSTSLSTMFTEIWLARLQVVFLMVLLSLKDSCRTPTSWTRTSSRYSTCSSSSRCKLRMHRAKEWSNQTWETFSSKCNKWTCRLNNLVMSELLTSQNTRQLS